MVGEEVQRPNLEVAVEEVLQVVQVEEELQVLQIQVEEELQVVQVEEELQVGEVLHAQCLLMQVLASLTKIFAALNYSTKQAFVRF